MSQRALQLHTSADEQISTLIELLATADDGALRRPCPGRENLGDGTTGAIAAHTAENYQRIATFIAAGASTPAGHSPRRHDRHRMPGWLRSLRHAAPGDGHDGPGAGGHADRFTGENARPAEIVERLEAARGELSRIAQLTDAQLDGVPPKDSFRFCDGERTLEQVIAGLLKHQGHQIQALQAALTPTR